MTKFDFHKVELTLGEAMHRTFIKKLVRGEPVAYPGAVSFYGVNVPKPQPQDSVIEALADWKKEALEEEIALQKEQGQQEGLPQPAVSSDEIPPPVAEIPFKEPTAAPPVHPMYILRKRILWFIKHRVANIYKLLGTTKEEVIALRKKKDPTPEEQKRIHEILDKSTEINHRLMKKLGIDTDEALVEREQKRHIRKRFNINETWLPL